MYYSDTVDSQPMVDPNLRQEPGKFAQAIVADDKNIHMTCNELYTVRPRPNGSRTERGLLELTAVDGVIVCDFDSLAGHEDCISSEMLRVALRDCTEGVDPSHVSSFDFSRTMVPMAYVKRIIDYVKLMRDTGDYGCYRRFPEAYRVGFINTLRSPHKEFCQYYLQKENWVELILTLHFVSWADIELISTVLSGIYIALLSQQSTCKQLEAADEMVRVVFAQYLQIQYSDILPADKRELLCSLMMKSLEDLRSMPFLDPACLEKPLASETEFKARQAVLDSLDLQQIEALKKQLKDETAAKIADNERLLQMACASRIGGISVGEERRLERSERAISSMAAFGAASSAAPIASASEDVEMSS